MLAYCMCRACVGGDRRGAIVGRRVEPQHQARLMARRRQRCNTNDATRTKGDEGSKNKGDINVLTSSHVDRGLVSWKVMGCGSRREWGGVGGWRWEKLGGMRKGRKKRSAASVGGLVI